MHSILMLGAKRLKVEEYSLWILSWSALFCTAPHSDEQHWHSTTQVSFKPFQSNEFHDMNNILIPSIFSLVKSGWYLSQECPGFCRGPNRLRRRHPNTSEGVWKISEGKWRFQGKWLQLWLWMKMVWWRAVGKRLCDGKDYFSLAVLLMVRWCLRKRGEYRQPLHSST